MAGFGTVGSGVWNTLEKNGELISERTGNGVSLANAHAVAASRSMPLWAHLGWSLGIWGSFVGSVLMLLRRRHAVTAFVVSLLGAIASFAAQGLAGVLTPAEPVMILTVIALLLWVCRRAQGQGLLT